MSDHQLTLGFGDSKVSVSVNVVNRALEARDSLWALCTKVRECRDEPTSEQLLHLISYLTSLTESRWEKLQRKGVAHSQLLSIQFVSALSICIAGRGGGTPMTASSAPQSS